MPSLLNILFFAPYNRCASVRSSTYLGCQVSPLIWVRYAVGYKASPGRLKEIVKGGENNGEGCSESAGPKSFRCKTHLGPKRKTCAGGASMSRSITAVLPGRIRSLQAVGPIEVSRLLEGCPITVPGTPGWLATRPLPGAMVRALAFACRERGDTFSSLARHSNSVIAVRATSQPAPKCLRSPSRPHNFSP